MKNDEHQSSTSSSSAVKTNGHWQSPARAAALQEQVIDTAKKAYSDFIDVAGDAVNSANTQAAKYIRQYPVQVAVGALAVGFLLGARLLRRKA